MSFRDKVEFSMVASKERQHGERIPNLTKYKMRVLPIAAIYGGNASGKTNLFKALAFAQDLVVKVRQPDSPIPVEPFRLDLFSSDMPTRFSFELLIEEIVYEYSFVVNTKSVLEEKLVEVTSASERTLFDRKDNASNFARSLANDPALKFAFKGTRDNQLFLTNSVSQKIEMFQSIYDWFKNSLTLVAPDKRFGPFDHFLDEKSPLYSKMNEVLAQFDSGISHLGSETVPLDSIPISNDLKSRLQEDIKENTAALLFSDASNERYIISRQDGQLASKKIITYHPTVEGSEKKFDIRQESDGSQRIIALLPAFLLLSEPSSSKVIVFDELDRSLHTLLTRRLIESYLSSCSHASRSQLLMTTHDILQMDQDLFRRDEMWVVERSSEGISSLVAFSDFKNVRYDLDIRKSYLQGRLGGIPRFRKGING
jgi:AAA15 family ATPase/GTPase